MTINGNRMNCGDVSLAILAATLHAQYKVRFVCQMRSRNVCRKYELKSESTHICCGAETE
jgi:hypothetical protein